MSNTLKANGGQPQKPTRSACISTPRFSQGLWTQRSPLRDAGSTRIEEKFYGSRGDAWIDGLNAEISNRLTPVRRPGNTVYNSSTFTSVDRFYEFRLFGPNVESIRVMVDQTDALYDGTGPSTKSSIWTKSTGAGQSSMQSVGNTLFFGNGVDQKKWLQTVQTWSANTLYSPAMSTFLIKGGQIQQLYSTFLTPTAITINSDGSMEVTCNQSNVDQILSIGLQIKFSGIFTFVGHHMIGFTINGMVLYISSVTATGFVCGAAANSTTDQGRQNIALLAANASSTLRVDGLCYVQQGGNAYSGASEPTWNTTVGGSTFDGNAIWFNCGSPVQNWGIQPPTLPVSTSISGPTGSWGSSTYYSPDGLIVVTVSAVQYLMQVTTPGVTGTVAPSWNTTLNGNTTDGTVVWKTIATDLVWHAHHTYDPSTPTYVVATASGVQCLFKATAGTGITFVDDGVHPGLPVTVNYLTDTASGTNFGDSGDSNYSGFQWSYPTASAHITNTSHITSLLMNPFAFNPSPVGGTAFHQSPVAFAVLNGAGEITGFTTPFVGMRQEKYGMTFSGTFNIPSDNLTVTFSIQHDDGFLFGIDGGAKLVSGPKNNPYGQTVTAIKSYPILGAQNVAGATTESYSVFFPVAGSYNFEFDVSQWEGGSEFMVTAGENIVLPPFESSTSAPPWPAWTLTTAPTKPSVYDASTNAAANFVNPSSKALKWENQGPISDMVWRAATTVALGGGIVDSNGNGEIPYQSGVSGTTVPTWKSTINNLTADAPNLWWKNTGTAPAAPAGTISTFLGGWEYCIALVNSVDSTVSNANQLSAATGNFNGAFGVTIAPGSGLPTAIDPQVDYVAIFRTVDGGATPFLIPGLDNCQIATLRLTDYIATGYTDTTLDTGLNNLLSAPILGENTVPPVGATNLALHLGRIFFSVGNTIYWTSGADTPVGNGVNGYSPANVAEVQALVTRIVPTSIGALIFTVSDLYIITGNAVTTPLFPSLYAQGIGLLSYNALDINGTIIYMFTSDSEILSIDPGASGATRIGFPISDQFRKSNWNPANAYVTWHQDGDDVGLFIADGSTGWFRMIATPAPETGVTWSTFASISGGCKAVQSVEVTPGVHRLLIGTVSTGPVLKRDLSHFNDNGVTYPYNFVIGSIILAETGQLARVSHISTVCPRIGARPTVSVILNEAKPYYTGSFETLGYYTNEPPDLPESQSLYRQRFYLSQSQDSAVCQDLQIQFSWSPEDAQNELLLCEIFGDFTQES